MPAAAVRTTTVPTGHAVLPLEQTRHIRLGRGNDGGFRRGLRIANERGLRGILNGRAGHLNDAFGHFKLLVFGREALEFKPKQAAGTGGQARANLPANPGHDHAAQGAAGDRQSFLDGTLEEAAERPQQRRLQSAADKASCFLKESAEELVELLFVADFQQIRSKLFDFIFAEGLSPWLPYS